MGTPKEKPFTLPPSNRNRDLTLVAPEEPDRKTLWNTVLMIFRQPQPTSSEQLGKAEKANPSAVDQPKQSSQQATELKVSLNTSTAIKETETQDQTKHTQTDISESDHTSIFSPNETIQMALPKDSRLKAALRSGRFFLYSAIIIIVFYFSKDFLLQVTQLPLFTGSSNDQPFTELPKDIVTSATPKLTKPLNDARSSEVNLKDIGRGLIYSCIHQKFICTDKTNYIKCRKMAKNSQGKSKACAVQGVFDSLNDCIRAKNSGTKSAKGLCP